MGICADNCHTALWLNARAPDRALRQAACMSRCAARRASDASFDRNMGAHSRMSGPVRAQNTSLSNAAPIAGNSTACYAAAGARRCSTSPTRHLTVHDRCRDGGHGTGRRGRHRRSLGRWHHGGLCQIGAVSPQSKYVGRQYPRLLPRRAWRSPRVTPDAASKRWSSRSGRPANDSSVAGVSSREHG